MNEATIAYYEVLLSHLKTSSKPTGLRTAALEHLALGISQVAAAKKHGVKQSNLSRLLKSIGKLDQWVLEVSEMRAQVVFPNLLSAYHDDKQQVAHANHKAHSRRRKSPTQPSTRLTWS